jgi:hypothetical protein
MLSRLKNNFGNGGTRDRVLAERKGGSFGWSR